MGLPIQTRCDVPAGELARAFRRETRLRATTRWLEARLALAGRRGRPVIAGPWMSEVGFELLYWIPLLRRLLHRHRIDRERVTVVTRGGAGLWYADLAANVVDILDLVSVDEFRALQERRQSAAGHQKQLEISAVEREILRMAGLRPEAGGWAHPLLAYSRLRYVFDARQPVARLDALCEYRRIEVAQPGIAEPYVAVKAYFSDCHPDTPENRTALQEHVDRLATDIDVVLLDTGLRIDDHRDAGPAAGGRVRSLCEGMSPAENLATQTRAIAGAAAYVATYGGMSYLGPFLGVPTTALFSERNYNGVHLAAMQRAAAGLRSPGFIVRDLSAISPAALAATVLPRTASR